MQTEKRRTKEDTWRPDELKKHIRVAQDDSDVLKTSKPRRNEEGINDNGMDARELRYKEKVEVEKGRHRSRERTTQKDEDKEKHRRKEERHREREMEREAKHRSKTKDIEENLLREREREKDKRREGDRERRKERDGDRGDGEREQRTDRERARRKEGERDQRKHREDRERRKEEEKEQRRDRERERSHDRERKKDRDREQKKERDYEKHRGKEGEGGQHKETGDIRKEGEKSHRKERDGEKDQYRERRNDRDREARKEQDMDRERRKTEGREAERDTDKEERHREKEKDLERERRKERRREREHNYRDRIKETDKDDKDMEKDRKKRDGRSRDRSKYSEKVENEETGKRQKDKRNKGEKSSEDEEHDRNNHRRERKHRQKKSSEQEVSEEPPSKAEVNSPKLSSQRQLSMWRSNEKGLSDTEEPMEEKEDITVEKDYEESNDNYEDDFEDYDDDFEDMDDNDEDFEDPPPEAEANFPVKNAEIEDIQRAINAENERVIIGQQGRKLEESDVVQQGRSDTQGRGSHRGKFIDFVAAKRREVNQKAASKQKKRTTELLRLIDLDFSVNFSLLDLPPLNEYDMYIRNFGTTNTKQAYVQCNEDNVDRDIQTEITETTEKWTQHPGESSIVCGGPSINGESSLKSQNKMNIDSQRLSNFLWSASQVIAILLEEDRAGKQSEQNLLSQPASLSFGDGCLNLNVHLPLLNGRNISILKFSPVQKNTILSVHSPLRTCSTHLDTMSIVCVWNIWEPSSPQKILVCESEITCCCFSPVKAALIFAGTSDGSVLLWDLREHFSLHYTTKIGDQDWTLRYPTFSTNAIFPTSSHSYPIRAAEAVSTNLEDENSKGFSLLSSPEETLGLSFLIASLDENGVLNLWVVVELPKADQAGSLTDLGLRPGGKIKLLHSSSILINSSLQRKSLQLSQAVTLKFLPSDNNQFLIGTEMSLVNHGSRHGLHVPQRFYKSQSGAKPASVTSLEFSSFEETIFLVGCSDGSIRLHSVMTEMPIMEWNYSTNGKSVVCIQWAPTRPAVFFVLDSASYIYIWDLLVKDYEPIVREKNHSDKITAMAVFGDPNKQNALSGISLAKESGKIEIQYLTKEWSVPEHQEAKKFHEALIEEC
ncbi:cytoplasmic dynein 2 intermediate chain 1 isoform X1 [Polypterus senegalus]|uniref:cytoplasmic dynein 2 intermediate chain 1 isoform X1 n=1 Tax=Polypterus senegalus TaxID=55291 RepID=UPI0019651B88|nr:cytoplasmic dynein 2 intermediate chain 1 isoform X1 [Polypterus senegalus]